MDSNVEMEMRICNSILKKFSDELKDCQKDYDFLKSIDKSERNDEYASAVESVIERYEGLTTSIQLIQDRLEVLKAKDN